MKFVKGDVIASLVITVVNILGGLAIGVGQKGMPAVDALKRYGLLTIGDGLVSQIPALVLSTAAGVLVTRVASEEPDTPLGEELARQLFGMPKALRVASVFVFLLALVPGLPDGAVPRHRGAALLRRARARTRSSRATTSARRPSRAPQPQTRRGPQFVPMVVPWSIEVSADLAALLDDQPTAEGERLGVRGRALALRELLFAELGVPLPAPRVRAVAGLPAAPRASSRSSRSPRASSPSPRRSDDDAAIDLVDRRRPPSSCARAPRISSASPRRSASSTSSSSSRPPTVRNVVPKPVSLTLLADVLRRLVEERIAIRDLRAILEALAVVASDREGSAEPHRVRARPAPPRSSRSSSRAARRSSASSSSIR